MDNTTHYEGPILAENGIALMLETWGGVEAKILLDTGMRGDALLNNADVLGIDLAELDAIVLSHNHYDHTGGLLKVLSHVGKPTPVIAHPEALDRTKYAIVPSLGLKKLTYAGPPFSKEDVWRAGGLLLLSKGPVTIAEGVVTTGEVPRRNDFEVVSGFYKVVDGLFTPDSLPDDQALVVTLSDNSLLVLTGCGHSGVVNTVNRALEVTGASRVRAVIGGFHLIDASEERIEKTISGLLELGVEAVIPMHCTGFRARTLMREKLPGFRELYCGESVEFHAD